MHGGSSHVPGENVAVEAHTALSGPAPTAALVEERLQARVSDLHAQLIVEARRHEVRSRSRLAAHRDLFAAAAGDSECRQFEASADGTSSVSIDRSCANSRAHIRSIDLRRRR